MSSYDNVNADGSLTGRPEAAHAYENVTLGAPAARPIVAISQPEHSYVNIDGVAAGLQGVSIAGDNAPSEGYENVVIKGAPRSAPRTPEQAIADTKNQWYQPQLSRTGAEVVLHGAKTGRFVVRESSKAPPTHIDACFFSLTVVTTKASKSTFWNGIVMMEFLETSTRFCMARAGDDSNVYFKTLDDLVLILMTNRERGMEFNLPCPLMLP